MRKKTFTDKFIMIMISCLIIIMIFDIVPLLGWVKSLPPHHEIVEREGRRYHYHEGRFYRPGFLGFGFTVVHPPVGAMVTVLPPGHRTVIYEGVPYYYCEDTYYNSCPSGYSVVTPPPIRHTDSSVYASTQTLTSPGEIVTINIPNSTKGYNAVTLKKQDGGYLGPQGEFYTEMPTVKQLQELYGK
ncbi:MAG: DUF6515 family protein [Elusimicrobia bacterium]|nr:DUF6515 family protein [Elusimicrobiota bacterium]